MIEGQEGVTGPQWLRPGTLVSPVTFRHPSELAKVVVTADHVSDGRVELGLGAGWHEREPIPFSLMSGVLVGRDRAELRDRAAMPAEREGDDADPDAFLTSKLRPWIVGTVEEVAEQLGALRDAGVARVMCQHLLHTDLDAVALIARDLTPLVA